MTAKMIYVLYLIDEKEIGVIITTMKLKALDLSVIRQVQEGQ